MTTFKELIDFARQLDQKNVTPSPQKTGTRPQAVLEFDQDDLTKLSPNRHPIPVSPGPLPEEKITHGVGVISFRPKPIYNSNPVPTTFSKWDLVWRAIDDLLNAAHQTFVSSTVLPKFQCLTGDQSLCLPFLSQNPDQGDCYGLYQAAFLKNSDSQPRQLTITFDEGGNGMWGVGLLTFELENMAFQLRLGEFTDQNSPYPNQKRHVTANSLALHPGQVGLLVCVGAPGDWQNFSRFANNSGNFGRGVFQSHLNWSDLPVFSEPMTALKNGTHNLSDLLSKGEPKNGY